MNTCPTCGELAVTQCRCPRSESRCKNGHDWFYCLAHIPPKSVVGKADHAKTDWEKCFCVQEHPSCSMVGAEPTPEEARAYLLSRAPDIAKVPRMFLKDAARVAEAAEAFLKVVKVEEPKP